jgi:hypothetical protein
LVDFVEIVRVMREELRVRVVPGVKWCDELDRALVSWIEAQVMARGGPKQIYSEDCSRD